ncbi:MAG: hypothetical protein QOE61_4270, partial [Micromonosporaceae bacterium]|nr:hypothetical protein [Micromonosporaceae bacterium]
QAEIDAIDARAPGIAEWLLRPLRSSGQLSAVAGRESLSDGLTVIATPGHTPGHQSVLLETNDERLLITGDLLVHVLQLIDPSLRYHHEDDPEKAQASRSTLLRDLAAKGKTDLATPHLGDPFVALTNS